MLLFLGSLGLRGLEVLCDKVRGKETFASMVGALPPVGITVIRDYHWKQQEVVLDPSSVIRTNIQAYFYYGNIYYCLTRGSRQQTFYGFREILPISPALKVSSLSSAASKSYNALAFFSSFFGFAVLLLLLAPVLQKVGILMHLNLSWNRLQ